MKKITQVLTILLIGIVGTISAQTFQITASPFEGVQSASAAFSDVDGDGDADVLITGLNSTSQRIAKLYANDGNGGYSLVAGTTFDGVQQGSVAFSDIDGDGDADVLVTGNNSVNQRISKLYANDGNGDYNLVAGTPFEGVQSGSVAFSDVDGDGDADLLITGINSVNQPIAKLYTNDGNGGYSLVAGTPFDGVANSSVAFSDVDGDGDADVLISGINSTSQRTAKLYTNDGNGGYSLIASPFDGVNFSSVAFSDVDGDGDADLLITGQNSASQRTAKLYANDGNGAYSLVVGTPFDGVQSGSVVFSDVDGDGHADVLITGYNSANQPIAKLYVSDGIGGYSLVAATPFEGVYSSSIAFSDMDGDGDDDLVITGLNSSNQRIAVLYRNIPLIADTPPTAVCQDITVQLDANGNVTIQAADVDNGSSDLEGPITLSLDMYTFDCSNFGPNTVTLTATDSIGQTDTCTATVTVEDNVAPIANCAAPFTIQLDANGIASITVSDIDNGSTDACGIASTTIDIDTFDCSNVGNNTITLTVTDVNGNISTCTTVVTVEDIVPPTAVCQNITVQLDANGNASITAADLDGGSTDACGIASTTIDVSTFDCSNVGPNNVVLTVTDNNGNISTCTAVVTVEDNVAPIANCAAPFTIQLDANGNASITVADIDNGSTDACGNASTTIDIDTFDCSNVGDNTVTLMVTDINGNVSTCTTIVTVEDNVAPIANCAAPFTIQLDANGNASITVADIDNGSTDACGILSTTIDIDTFDCSNVGPNNIILTVTDVNGNVSTCTTIVTVEDNVAPIANCAAPFTIQLDTNGNASITVADIDNGSTDACGIASTTIDIDTFDCSNVGNNTITLTVTDVNGNISTCTTVVTVEDNVAPTAVCQDITVQLDANGNVSITPADVDGGSTDACGVGSTSIDINTFDCSNVGPNNVILTVTDSNGNISTCTAVVTVEDNVAPIANCVSPFTIQLDANGNASITVADIDNGSTDACGIASTTIDITDFDCSNVGDNTVTLTVTDVNGNVSTCTTIVTVEDNVAPIANCTAPFTIQLDANGNATITVADIDNGSADACGIASTTIDVSTFDCSNVGANNVILTVTDVNGNVSTCTTIVTVEDNVAPTAVCQNFTVQLDANGNASITASDVDGGSADACGIESTIIDILTFDCSNVGANNVILTLTDNNGNVSTCTAVVTVEDSMAPTIVCQADITTNTDAGDCFATISFSMPTALDNCGIATVVQTMGDPSGSQFPVGVNTIEFMATDVNGNTSSCSFTITVTDNEAPVAVCQNITVQLDTNGNANITAVDVDGGSTDQCGMASTTIDINTFDCSNVGLNNVILTVTDNNGNVSTCSATVTVEDNVAPTAVCQNISVQLDANGNASVTAADVDGGSSDACGIASMTIDISTFDCSNVGANNVILTVTDNNGNVSTCTAIVTVDDTPPTAVCQNITVQLDANGNVSITPADVDGGSADSCGIASMTIDISTFDCSNVGQNNVVLMVTDNNGNVTTCTAVVTVEDNTSPVLVCQDFTLELGADGTATLSPSDVIASNDDACGILTTAVDITQFSCADIGTTVTVQVFSQDNNGNLATCTAVVTVVDNLAPVVTCPADQTVDPGAGNLFYILPDYFATGEATAVDNCTDPVTITTQDPAVGTPLPDGTYTITLTATDEYGNTSTCEFELTVESILGIGNNSQSLGTISMYPNPAKGNVTIGNPQSLALESANIYDLTGRQVQTFNLRGMATAKTLNVDNLAAATYVVIIKGKEGQITKRLIKE